MSRPDPATAWEDVLDVLEHQLDRAVSLLTSADLEALLDWQAPTGLAPIPEHLVPRAQTLLRRQQAVVDRLPELIERTRRQLRVGDRIGQATVRTPGPAYLDVTA